MASAEVRIKNYDRHVWLKKGKLLSLLFFSAKDAAKYGSNTKAQKVGGSERMCNIAPADDHPIATEVHCSLLNAVATAVIYWL